MRKALIVSTLGRQFYLFESANIHVLKELGYEVHGAANLVEDDPARLQSVAIEQHHIDLQRSPLALKNVIAARQLIELMRREDFDLVHCHAPMGGVVGRVAARWARVPHTVYTAHGFHFFKGAPLINWVLFYPVEALLARVTDIIITINSEDYAIACKMARGGVVQIPGVGVDTARFSMSPGLRSSMRRQLSLPDAAVVALSVGELNKNKDHETSIRALALAPSEVLHLLICGRGKEERNLRGLARTLGIGDRVHFLGFRDNIPEIAAASDLFVSSSTREGLPVSCIEAMSAGLPLICTRIRGHVDLLEEGVNGLGFEVADADGLSACLMSLALSPMRRTIMGRNSLERSHLFDSSLVEAVMRRVYGDLVKHDSPAPQ